MPRTNIPITTIVRAGVAPPAVVNSDVANQHEIPYNNGTVFIECANTHATLARTITVETPGVVDGLAIADLVVSVPATSTRIIGPFPSATYSQSDGKVNINVDGSAGDVRFRAYALT